MNVKLSLGFVLVCISSILFGQQRPETITKENYYHIKRGNIGFHATRLFFDDGIFFGTSKTDTISLYNAGEKDIELRFDNIPEFLSCELMPQILKPGQEGKIAVKYDSKIKNVYGPTFDYFMMKTSDELEPTKRLITSPDIYEDFSTLTDQQKKNAPEIKFTEHKFDFGTIEQGEEVFHVFEFMNTGKRDLIIRTTKASCGCTASELVSDVIAPGKKAEIQVTFTSIGKKDKQKHMVTVVSNDPNNPVVILEMKGFVEVPEKK
ncbi:MAG: DUF1573 domain-containing protein [Bacteroidales bacterium]|nr:DUF1573 domain-containing protein [Bacteroidales bacterium]